MGYRFLYISLLLLAVILTACLHKSDSPTDSSNISTNKILDILSTKNKDVIAQFGISDAEKEQNIGEERFNIPIFRCNNPDIYICFNGSSFDSVNTISQADETPYKIIPINGTIVHFDENFSFRVGDDIKRFKEVFGEGEFGEYSNQKGDKQTYHLKFAIDNLEIEFSSYNAEFTDYLFLVYKA